MMQPGIHHDLHPLAYHADEARSSSDLRYEWPTPSHFLEWLTSRKKKPETPAMRLGSLIHVAVLEPDRFDRECVVEPDYGEIYGKHKNGHLTAEGKAARAEFQSEHFGATLVDAEDKFRMVGMAMSIRAHTGAAKLIHCKGANEVSICWDDPETGIRCRGRIDKHSTGLALLDLKSCRSAHRRFFQTDASKRGYHAQAAMYEKGWSILTGEHEIYTLVAVESEPPFGVIVYTYGPDDIQEGWKVIRKNLRTIADCTASGKWPGYLPETVQDLGLPPWARTNTIGDWNESTTEAGTEPGGRGGGDGSGEADGDGGDDTFATLPGADFDFGPPG